jgi:predicted RNA binding protein YcfA (HicA-like mRNA interferase family)
LKQISGKDLAKAVQKRGWALSRVNGSHHIFTKAGRPERIVIPIHGNHPLKIGLLKALMKIADLQEKDI